MEVNGEALCSTTDIQLLELNWTETDWWWPFFPPRNSRVCQQFTTFPSPPHPQGVFYNCSIASMRTFRSNAHLHDYCLRRPSRPWLCRRGYSPLVESSVGVRPSKWDRPLCCYSYHRRYWPGVLWFPLLILLRCTVERGYVGPAKVYFVEVIDKLDNGDHTVEFYSGNPKRTKETLTLRIWNKF